MTPRELLIKMLVNEVIPYLDDESLQTLCSRSGQELQERQSEPSLTIRREMYRQVLDMRHETF